MWMGYRSRCGPWAPGSEQVVRYAILGPIELCDGKHRRPVRGPRQVALLALLLLNANRVVSSDRLIEALWGDLGPAGAVKRLQVAILRLRRVLDPAGGQGESVLQMVTGGYLLTVAPASLIPRCFRRTWTTGSARCRPAKRRAHATCCVRRWQCGVGLRC
jgi:DNA-binding winged helix-turn-helix (wHTH) protein